MEHRLGTVELVADVPLADAKTILRSRTSACNPRETSLFHIGLCLQASNNLEAHTNAAVIIDADDEGSVSLDRYRFAPGLIERLN